MVIVVFKQKEYVQTTINELDLVKLRLVGRHHFDRLNIQNWQISAGIPSEDIIMQNIGNLHEDNSFFQMFQTVKTIFYSILVIIAILCVEALSLSLMPAISPLILYMTSTVIALFAFYGTPWLVFKSVDAE